MCSNAWRSRIASSSTCAGSKLASRSAAMPISGVLMRLVLPALRRQGQAGRRGDQQEPRVLVAGVDQRIEAAVDERIVHRADRQQPRAGHRRRQPGRAQQQEQVLLGDAQLDVLALSATCPSAARCASLASRNTSLRVCRSKMPRRFTQGPRLVETVTSGLVVTMCAASSFSSPCPRPISARMSPKPRLRGHLAPGQLRRRQRRRHRHHRRASARALPASAAWRTGRRRGTPRNSASGTIQALEQVPFVAGPDAHVGAEHLHLLLGHQAGMVVLVAGERQAHALDRVGDEAGRLVAVGVGGAQASRSASRCRGRRDWSSARPARRPTAGR